MRGFSLLALARTSKFISKRRLRRTNLELSRLVKHVLPNACATLHIFVCGKQVKMLQSRGSEGERGWDFKPDIRLRNEVPKWNRLDRPCGGGVKEERTAGRQVAQTGVGIGRDNTKLETVGHSVFSAEQLRAIRSRWGAQVWASEWRVCGQIQAAMQRGWMRYKHVCVRRRRPVASMSSLKLATPPLPAKIRQTASRLSLLHFFLTWHFHLSNKTLVLYLRSSFPPS